jgi:hypothetical protein
MLSGLRLGLNNGKRTTKVIHEGISGHLAGVMVHESILSIGILQPCLQLLQCLETMRDLVLFFLVHFGIPKELSKTVCYLPINRLTFGLCIRKLDPNL